MNICRVFVLVPFELCQRSLDFAKELVKHYAEGGSVGSRSVSGHRGTEKDVPKQVRGKVGECAVAIYFGMNPEMAVKWSMQADKGADLTLSNGMRVDVKTTFPPYHLIWSNNVNDLFDDKEFDALVSVSIDEHDYKKCWIEGWVYKDVFLRCKKVADGIRGHKLEAGTWYMAKADLLPINNLMKAFPLTTVVAEEIEPIRWPHQGEAYNRGLIKLAREGQKPYWIRAPRNEGS